MTCYAYKVCYIKISDVYSRVPVNYGQKTDFGRFGEHPNRGDFQMKKTIFDKFGFGNPVTDQIKITISRTFGNCW